MGQAMPFTARPGEDLPAIEQFDTPEFFVDGIEKVEVFPDRVHALYYQVRPRADGPPERPIVVRLIWSRSGWEAMLDEYFRKVHVTGPN